MSEFRRIKERERETGKKRERKYIGRKKIFCPPKNDVLFEGEEKRVSCEGIDLKKAISDGQVEVK